MYLLRGDRGGEQRHDCKDKGGTGGRQLQLLQTQLAAMAGVVSDVPIAESSHRETGAKWVPQARDWRW